MEKIINYDMLPLSSGQSIYFRMETDPKLYISLMSKGYKLVRDIHDAGEDTIYVTGRRQDFESKSTEEYKTKFEKKFQDLLGKKSIYKPLTYKFSFDSLINHEYKLPFVLKNESQNGGREKFLISTEEDYENLINSVIVLLNPPLLNNLFKDSNDQRRLIDYKKYLNNFTVQEYVVTPSKYNTTVRLLTSASNDLLYASLKYNEKEKYKDKTSLLGVLLSDVYPLSTKSIVSNTLSGGKNILLGESNYTKEEKELLESHNIESNKFHELVDISKNVHERLKRELGIICGFDYIYDKEKDKWFLLEYHSRPMVGDYSKRQGISYDTSEDRISAEGRVRATALSLALKKK